MANVEFTGIHHVKLPVSDLPAAVSGTNGCSATPSTGRFLTTTAWYAASAGGCRARWLGTAVLGGYVAVALALAYWLLARRDV